MYDPDGRISEILARMYADNYQLIAELCDEYLDRSAKLLGVVRHKAALPSARPEGE